jgi:hypothetical protein
LAVIADLPNLVELEIDSASQLTSLQGINNLAFIQAAHLFKDQPELHKVLLELKELLKLDPNTELDDETLHPFLKKTDFKDIFKYMKHIKMGQILFDKIHIYYGNLYNMLTKEKKNVQSIPINLILFTLSKTSLEEAITEFEQLHPDINPKNNPEINKISKQLYEHFISQISYVWEHGTKSLDRPTRDGMKFTHYTLLCEVIYEILHSSSDEYSFDNWHNNPYRKETLEYASELSKKNAPEEVQEHIVVKQIQENRLVKLSHPKLHKIVVTNTHLSNPLGIDEFSRTPELNHLEITGCELTNAHVNKFSHMPQLATLNLSNNKISDATKPITAVGFSQMGKTILFSFSDLRKTIFYGFLIMVAEVFDPKDLSENSNQAIRKMLSITS